MTRVKIIGTSHISKRSMEEIKREMNALKPDIVAVELDQGRLASLEEKVKRKPSLKDIPSIGLQGYFFTLIGGYLQRKLGNIVGVEPGSDMLCAVNLAKEKGAHIELIDRDIRVTLYRLSKSFGWKDKLNMLSDMIKGVLFKDERIKIDLNSVPPEEMIDMLMEKMRTRYRGLYVPLVEERNRYMSHRLYLLATANPGKTIVAVVGAGHKKGIIEELHKIYKFRRPEEVNGQLH